MELSTLIAVLIRDVESDRALFMRQPAAPSQLQLPSLGPICLYTDSDFVPSTLETYLSRLVHSMLATDGSAAVTPVSIVVSGVAGVELCIATLDSPSRVVARQRIVISIDYHYRGVRLLGVPPAPPSALWLPLSTVVNSRSVKGTPSSAMAHSPGTIASAAAVLAGTLYPLASILCQETSLAASTIAWTAMLSGASLDALKAMSRTDVPPSDQPQPVTLASLMRTAGQARGPAPVLSGLVSAGSPLAGVVYRRGTVRKSPRESRDVYPIRVGGRVATPSPVVAGSRGRGRARARGRPCAPPYTSTSSFRSGMTGTGTASACPVALPSRPLPGTVASSASPRVAAGAAPRASRGVPVPVGRTAWPVSVPRLAQAATASPGSDAVRGVVGTKRALSSSPAAPPLKFAAQSQSLQPAPASMAAPSVVVPRVPSGTSPVVIAGRTALPKP